MGRDLPEDGRRRAVVEGIDPEIDGGRFPAKRVVGDDVVVEADAFTDGHDSVRCVLLHRGPGQRKWREVEMKPLGNDRWRGSFTVGDVGRWQYTVEAWTDLFLTWWRDLEKRVGAGQDVEVDLLIGAELVEEAAERATGADARRLLEGARALRTEAGEGPASAGERSAEAGIGRTTADAGKGPARARSGVDPVNAGAGPGGAGARALDLLDETLAPLVLRHPDRSRATRHPRELPLVVDRPLARCSAWYELFPRSTGPAGEHGTLRTAMEMLPYVQEMGFDIVYLPPIHPIGATKRKAPNNREGAGPGDPGSPWAIGSEEGGHTAVHPDLGTLADFRAFRERAVELGLEVALDVAFQAAPDHPWIAEHPEWFRHRPDGTIQYAENPPKKYQDIVPLDFESEEWEALWRALKDVFDFWIEQGVTIFRVDNPHTKSFPFWEWCIAELEKEHPEIILLSEAFTRPKVMYRLAKLGFTQSYTYFAWRREKWELEQYLDELTRTEVREYFRPNFWPNTPDILTDQLQAGGREASAVRLVLAATLTANYGIYGPPFELAYVTAREEGSEEYLDSEKYQLRDWDLDDPRSLRHLIARVNRIRRENPALQRNDTLRFHPTDNDLLIAYSKRSTDGSNTILVVANLDPDHRQSGWVELRLEELGLAENESFRVRDLLGGGHFGWHGRRNYVELDPSAVPAHVFLVGRHPRTETDFGKAGR